MKTQLLEDIGQSAELSPAPSKPAGNAKARTGGHDLAPVPNAQPAKPRSAVGVWRQKPAGEPLPPTTPQLAEPAPLELEEPAPLELDKVFEEIAALEAQLVRPAQQPAPAIAPVEPRQALPASPAESLHQPAVAPLEATLAPDPTLSATVPQDPLFDFTVPSPAPYVADPFTPAQTAPTQSRKRYFVWAGCALSGALLILGGRWAYQERSDAGSLALVATQAKAAPRIDPALKERAIAATASTPEPGPDARVPPAVPESSPLPAVPPLVMLKPDPPAAIKPEQPPPLVARGGETSTARKTGVAAQQVPASPLAKPSSRKRRERSDAAAEPAKERRQREPVRQLARASAMGTERQSEQNTSLAALLRACRAHGYHATQCIKRQCSVGKYGFACRGR